MSKATRPITSDNWYGIGGLLLGVLGLISLLAMDYVERSSRDTMWAVGLTLAVGATALASIGLRSTGRAAEGMAVGGLIIGIFGLILGLGVLFAGPMGP